MTSILFLLQVEQRLGQIEELSHSEDDPFRGEFVAMYNLGFWYRMMMYIK